MLRPMRSLALAATLLVLAFVLSASAQSSPRHGRVIVPDTSVEHPGDAGVRAHTNHLIFVPEGAQPNSSTPSGETPASLGCVYQVVSPLAPGCTIAGSTVNPNGGAGGIALVDAYDDPTAANDIAVFSSQFGLPAPNFSVVYASGTKPAANCGWGQEESLDIEWAHAMAPNAKIYLVEASSSTISALLQAESVASSLVAAAGGGEISNSWSGGEFRGETSDDSKYFNTSGIVYFASSGDSAGKVGYPSASPKVVSAGGTGVQRDANGNFTGEVVWNDQYGGTGGGTSRYESRPSYQNSVSSIVGSKRGTPDFSFDADPASGVSVYDSTVCSGLSGWLVFGGTSVSSPALAGIVNLAGKFYTSSNTELTTIYSNLGNAGDFRDITSGTCGKYSALAGYDLCTGVGSDVGLAGK
jgi:kumamolisin